MSNVVAIPAPEWTAGLMRFGSGAPQGTLANACHVLISAMQALEAPLDDVRDALGLSRDQFMSEYGLYLRETAEMRRRGTVAYFAQHGAERKLGGR
jgi:hypothetical protein